MEQYYYHRYTIGYKTSSNFVRNEWVKDSTSAYKYTGMSLNETTGEITLTGRTWLPVSNWIGKYTSIGDNTAVERYVGSSYYSYNQSYYMDVHRYYSVKTNGTFITTIIADDGAYPANGISGSYWYIKGDKVFPKMSVNIGGVWKEAKEGWVNIGGTWRQLTEIWTNINGTWRKS